MGCRLWGYTESDTTEVTQQQQQKFITTANSGWGYALALLPEAEHGNSQTQESENESRSALSDSFSPMIFFLCVIKFTKNFVLLHPEHISVQFSHSVVSDSL